MSHIKKFIDGLNEANSVIDPERSETNGFQPLHLKEIIEKELPVMDIYPMLLAAKQDKINFKQIIVESEIDFINSAVQLKNVFDTQIKTAIYKLEEIYERESLNIKSLYHQNFFGKSFLNLIKVLNENKFSLVMMNERVYAYKYYDPPLSVDEGHYESGVIFNYDDSICELKGVYVNLLHPKITNGTVLINTERRHPNAKGSGLSEACTGSLDDKEIPINDPEALVQLLNSICEMYEIAHLDSAYFMPEQNYEKVEEEKKWTA